MALTTNGKNYILQKYGNTSNCCVASGLYFNYTDVSGYTYTSNAGGTATIAYFLTFGLAHSITMTYPSRPIIIDPSPAMDTANGSHLYPDDVSVFRDHDEQSADQWCYQAANVRCYTCSGTQAVYYDFPPGTVCGQGVASGFPYTTQPVCTSGGGTGCLNPPGSSGAYHCFGKNYFRCDGTQWVLVQENAPECSQCDCAAHMTQAECQDALSPEGQPCCYWYKKYLWESEKCHDVPQDFLRDYMPFIVGGVGIAVLLILLSSGKKKGQQIMVLPRDNRRRRD